MSTTYKYTDEFINSEIEKLVKEREDLAIRRKKKSVKMSAKLSAENGTAMKVVLPWSEREKEIRVKLNTYRTLLYKRRKAAKNNK